MKEPDKICPATALRLEFENFTVELWRGKYSENSVGDPGLGLLENIYLMDGKFMVHVSKWTY